MSTVLNTLESRDGLHPPVTTQFVTTDVSEAAAALSAAFTDVRLRLHGAGDAFRFEQTGHDLGGLRIDHFDSSFVSDFEMDGFDGVMVTRVFHGGMEVRTQGTDRSCGRGDVLLIARPGQEYTALDDNLRATTITIDLPLLGQVVGDGADELAQRLRYDTLGPEESRRWQQTVDYLDRTVLSVDELAASPLIVGAAARLMAATLATAFGAQPDPAPYDRTDAVPATVRRGVAFIEANPDLDLSVADIARAAHVSVRAVQLAFRRHLNTTPMRYLRRLRLDLAHAELRAADPSTGHTVTQTAMRWGYADMSRFAADYRAAYGEHPHRTLRSHSARLGTASFFA